MLPAHQKNRSNFIIPSSAASTTKPSSTELRTEANAPAATVEVLDPASTSSSSGWVEISRGVSGIMASP